MRIHFILPAAFALLATSPALASAAPKKIAVVDVRAIGTFDPKMVQGLSTLVASEAEKHPFKVIFGTDLAAVIGFEKQRQLLGCTDSSCLAEIGGALGADYLLTTEVSEVGGIWLLTNTLLDVTRASSVKRVTKKVEKVRDLVEAAQAATGEALAAIHPKEVAGAKPASSTAARPGAEARAEASPGGSTMRTAGIALDVAGAALLAGGATCGVLSLLQYDDAKKLPAGKPLEDAKSTGKTEGLVADVLYGVGGAALVVGLVLTVLGSGSSSSASPPADAVSTSVTFSPLPSGGAVSVSGRF